MKKLKVIGVIVLLATASAGSYAALTYGKCTGSSGCTACKNCKYCKYCAEDGGSCGVCSK